MQLSQLNFYKNKFILYTSFILLFTGIIFPQVKIQEKVYIKPDSIIERDKVYNISPGQKSSADFRLEFQYDNSVDAYFLFGLGDFSYASPKIGAPSVF